jgi:opacity protein-like surface antigen
MNRNLLTAILAFISFSAPAQFYIKGGVGYAFPQAGQTVDGSGTPYSAEANIIQTTAKEHSDFKLKKVSFSAGGNAVIGAGFMFTKNLGVELNAEIGLMSKKYTTKLSETFNNPEFANIEIKQYAKMPIMLSPSLILQTAGDKMNLYTRWGLALPLSTKIIGEETDVYDNGGGTETDKYGSEMTSKFNVGFSGAAGLKYKLSKKLSVWGEFNLLSLSVYVQKQQLKKFEVDGVDKLYLVNPKDQVINFKSEENTDDPANSNTQLTYSLPFSHVGINAGITFSL